MKRIRLGRDYTNMLLFSHLTKEEKNQALEEIELFKKGKGGSPYPSIINNAGLRQKANLIGQIKVAKKIKMPHVEIDADAGNPYIYMLKKQKKLCAKIKEFAKKNKVTISLHLPYTYVPESVCSIQEDDRKKAVELMKEYVKFGAAVGAKYANMHAGKIPFYHNSPFHMPIIKKALTKSVAEIAKECNKYKMQLHLENNVSDDSCFYNIEDIVEIITNVRNQGIKVNMCFDMGHYLTRADRGLDISKKERVLKDIPKGFLTGESHLASYIPKEFDSKGKQVPGTGRYHPTLDDPKNPIKKRNLKNMVKLFQEAKLDTIVVETAISAFEQIKIVDKLVSETNIYLDVFGYKNRIKPFDMDKLIPEDEIIFYKKLVEKI